MRLPTLPILALLISFTRADDPRIPCFRSQWWGVFTYTIQGYGNSEGGFTNDVCRDLKNNLKGKVACAIYGADTCKTEADGKYIVWTFDVLTVCHSKVSLEMFYSFCLLM